MSPIRYELPLVGWFSTRYAAPGRSESSTLCFWRVLEPNG